MNKVIVSCDFALDNKDSFQILNYNTHTKEITSLKSLQESYPNRFEFVGQTPRQKKLEELDDKIKLLTLRAILKEENV
jgi:hypothetical protein